MVSEKDLVIGVEEWRHAGRVIAADVDRGHVLCIGLWSKKDEELIVVVEYHAVVVFTRRIFGGNR